VGRAAIASSLIAGGVWCLALAGAPAARAEVVWLCKPGMTQNPCEIPQDTTVQEFGKADTVVMPQTGDRKIDCFYVYPTVSNQPTPNANKNRDPEEISIAKYQAARFNTECRIYAPIYRQATLASIQAGGADRNLAYGDVLEAWREYLAHDNDGRGVVLIGHSQGTAVLRRLLRTEIEAHSDQLRKLVSALLPGGNVTVPKDRLVGGDFRFTPLCTHRAQVACVVAYSTFDYDPPENARFGRSNPPDPKNNPAGFPGGPGYEIACTDPRPLAGMDADPLHILTPSEPFAPGIIEAGIVVTSKGQPPSAPTTWVVAPDRYQGGCRRIDGAHVLHYDPIGQSRSPMYFPDETWGTHLLDVQLGLDPMVSLVAQQAQRWVHPSVRLMSRCISGGRLRMTLAGRDTEFVRDVSFKFGRHRVARDTAAPFSKMVSRVLVAGRGGRPLRAVAYLKEGAPDRVILRSNGGACGPSR
jgi:hypothetical protein